MDIKTFLSEDKSIIIAPAGYGKTFTIAEAISVYNGNQKVLVLTHTHAGIASLREKFEQKGLAPSVYHLDTICSFALDLTKTYYIQKNEIPKESDANALFDYAVEHAAIILKANPIKQLLSIKYEHLIVDEYQDCTLAQHQMVLELAQTLKTHLLGDPLQGIFGFRGQQIVDFNDDSFWPFLQNSQLLETPWRWKNAGQDALGQDLASIREKLLVGEDIDLQEYHSIKWVQGAEDDYVKPQTNVRTALFQELNRGAVVIHPNSTSVEPRKSVVKHFPMLQLIEPIDGKEYYFCCQKFDSHSGQTLIKDISDMMRKICNKSCINNWIRPDGTLIRKQKQDDQEIKSKLESAMNSLLKEKTYVNIANLIVAIARLPEIAIYRKEFIRDIYYTLIDADKLGLTATEAIVRSRNILRRKGRKMTQKSIGTTLLTKGLEFDNVVILNAHLFKDPRHLYVALTRCCKRLVVISNSAVLHPYE
ncbi:MAG: ATP-dependent helicase [Bacteroidales bacterium]|nr:ATP-dependent helicase [Bacteroidales bacterium]